MGGSSLYNWLDGSLPGAWAVGRINSIACVRESVSQHYWQGNASCHMSNRLRVGFLSSGLHAMMHWCRLSCLGDLGSHHCSDPRLGDIFVSYQSLCV